MVATSRKPRPLSRGETTYRDDRLFILATDDTYAPRQYFEMFELSRVKILVIPTKDGTSSAAHVLSRLEQYEINDDDQRWLLLDTDHYIEPSHAASFIQAITEAKQKGICVALSNPCFDFWLLLHHVHDLTKLKRIKNAKCVSNELRTVLGSFNKTKIDKSKFPLSLVSIACECAKHLDEEVGGGDRPTQPTSRIYKLWHEIARATPKSQLPSSLWKLVDGGSVI